MALFDSLLHIKTDVLVIGGGIAAATAALEAVKTADVLLISKDRVVGGASIQASGGITFPGAAGEESEVFINDVLNGGEHINNRLLVEKLCAEGRHLLDYLKDMGVIFDVHPDGNGLRFFKKTEGHSVMRNYQDRRNFHEFAGILKSNIVKSSVKVLEHTMVFSMICTEGKVSGALAYKAADGAFVAVSAKTIILATGGYGRLYRRSDNSLGLTGEGHGMALDCGVSLMDMEMVQFIPLSLPYPPGREGAFLGMCSLYGPKTELENALGERFMKRYDHVNMEYSTRDTVARSIFREIAEGRGTPNGAVIVNTVKNDKTLLAAYRSSSAAAYSLIAEVFGEEAARWEKPFEAVPSQHFCMGGIEIDAKTQTGCENLYAAGEVSAGVHGANRLGGNAILEAFVFGRVSGQNAAEKALKEKSTSENPEMNSVTEYWRNKFERFESNAADKNSVSGQKIKLRISDILWNHGSLLRSKSSLEAGLRQLENVGESMSNMAVLPGTRQNSSVMEAMEAHYMYKVGKAVLMSALYREESRGAHYRYDFPEKNDAFLGNILVNQDIGGILKPFFRKIAAGGAAPKQFRL
ncbi:MAG: FAD-dependent oxidoreductase [Clostridiales Family XIII bacterium]|nr:FAD-dependent oxidoreductase [Clostridiales Family XIII bacterium]